MKNTNLTRLIIVCMLFALALASWVIAGVTILIQRTDISIWAAVLGGLLSGSIFVIVMPRNIAK